MRYVSWHEALAYCEWLNDVLATSSTFDGNPIARLVREQGWRVSLPSELEWEKAARGGLRDSVYSWGDDTGSEPGQLFRFGDRRHLGGRLLSRPTATVCTT